MFVPLMTSCRSPPLEQTLPRKFNLPPCLIRLETTSRYAHLPALGQLEFVFVGIPGAGAMVGEVNASERVGAQILVTRS